MDIVLPTWRDKNEIDYFLCKNKQIFEGVTEMGRQHKTDKRNKLENKTETNGKKLKY